MRVCYASHSRCNILQHQKKSKSSFTLRRTEWSAASPFFEPTKNLKSQIKQNHKKCVQVKLARNTTVVIRAIREGEMTYLVESLHDLVVVAVEGLAVDVLGHLLCPLGITV